MSSVFNKTKGYEGEGPPKGSRKGKPNKKSRKGSKKSKKAARRASNKQFKSALKKAEKTFGKKITPISRALAIKGGVKGSNYVRLHGMTPLVFVSTDNSTKPAQYHSLLAINSNGGVISNMQLNPYTMSYLGWGADQQVSQLKPLADMHEMWCGSFKIRYVPEIDTSVPGSWKLYYNPDPTNDDTNALGSITIEVQSSNRESKEIATSLWQGVNGQKFTDYSFPTPKNKWYWTRTSVDGRGQGNSDRRTVSPGNFCLFSETLPTTYGKTAELGKFYMMWDITFKNLVPSEYQPYQEWIYTQTVVASTAGLLVSFPDSGKQAPTSEQMVHNDVAGTTGGNLIVNAGYGVDCATSYNIVGFISNIDSVASFNVLTYLGQSVFSDASGALAPNTSCQLDFVGLDSSNVLYFSALFVTAANAPSGSFSVNLVFKSHTGTSCAVDVWIQPTIVFASDFGASAVRHVTKHNPMGIPYHQLKGIPQSHLVSPIDRHALHGKKPKAVSDVRWWKDFPDEKEEKEDFEQLDIDEAHLSLSRDTSRANAANFPVMNEINSGITSSISSPKKSRSAK